MQQLFRPFNVLLSGNPLFARERCNATTAKQLLKSISV
jgi:hypothetical protein